MTSLIDSNDGARATALSLLESGAGVPVHIEGLEAMSRRWDELGRVIESSEDTDYAQVLATVSFCSAVLRNGRADLTAQCGVVDPRLADWFPETRKALLSQDLERTEVLDIHRDGARVLSALRKALVLPELDSSAVVDPQLRTPSGEDFFDTDVAIIKLSRLVHS